ncbi:hypothetical protein A0J61_10935 [Choanephora cucurbitarum]|uniref:Uncharacterized protein n=1 Tax=Choanephora cucurbitarum TaxID=101091 RepID=A0A1C7MX44_9FUNG|nr:hypothetical protein A0J61_10935 [Choanephora cucurbitarum]
MCQALFTEEVKYDVTVIPESNKVVLTNFVNDSVEHLWPFDDNQNINLLYGWRLSSDRRYLIMAGLFDRRNVYIKVWDFWIKRYVYPERVGVDLVFSIKPFIVLQHEDTAATADCIGKMHCLARVQYKSNTTILDLSLNSGKQDVNKTSVSPKEEFFSV